MNNIYYHAALKAVTAQVSPLLRDFRSIQKQVSSVSKEKTAHSIYSYCMQSVAKILFSNTQFQINNEETDHWHVKVIDGFDNFCTGNPMFSVLVSLIKDSQVNFAMLSIPVLGKILYTSPGNGLLSYAGEYSVTHSTSRNMKLNEKYIALANS